MKKIEIINKVTEINVKVVDLLQNVNDEKFKTVIEEFLSEFGLDSDNFMNVISYYHGGKRVEDFISGVNYYMNTTDEDDITYKQANEDLKVMKKLYEIILKSYEEIEGFVCFKYNEKDVNEATTVVKRIINKGNKDITISHMEFNIYDFVRFCRLYNNYEFEGSHPILCMNLHKKSIDEFTLIKTYNLIKNLSIFIKYNHREPLETETLVYALHVLSNTVCWTTL